MSIKLLLRYTCACTVTAGDVSDGLYRYTEDLLALKAAAHYEVSLPSNCGHITSPLEARVWERLLATHPDRQYANFIVNGIQRGFCIGCSANRSDLRSTTRNMLAAYNNSSVVNKYLKEELEYGRLMKVQPPLASLIHVSKLGVIPKKHQPGKWRLIVDVVTQRSKYQ